MPEKVEVVLGNQIYLAKEGLPPALRNRLIRLAAFQNPDFYRAQALRFPTFDKPRIVACCEDFPRHLGIPRGCLDEVLDLLDSLKIKTVLTDERVSGFSLTLQFHGALRADQQNAAKAILDHDAGVLAASTALGKTVVACYAIAERSVNTLVPVYRRQLLEQWIERLCMFLGLQMNDIGQIAGAKKNPTGRIDVALIQGLSRKGVVNDIVAEYGHLVVDECHHVSTRSFEIVARQAKARFVLGLSATLERKDGHHPIIFMQCGPIRYRVDDRDQAATRPFGHKVIVKDTGVRLPECFQAKDRAPIHEVYSFLMNDTLRNDLIVRDVLEAVRQERAPLVLTERTEHLQILADRLSLSVRNVLVFRGGMGKRQREQLAKDLASIPENEERVLVATGRYLGEGFDDARLDTLFLTLPISWRGTLAQYVGRLHRSHHLKREAIVYDYTDLSIPMLANMHRRRLSGYKAIGYTIENLLSDSAEGKRA
ncbi:DEAD/DEAH box helicase [Candidatus Sumerlaeota bacterium]|nr:DEAD/DEAH box helicase [Candidatus Sumerlaeota bacterium]